MRDPQEMAPPSGQYQLQFLWWVWSHCRNPEGSGTQEGKTYRGEAAEQDDAAAAAVDVVDDVADAAVVAGQKPVGTVAAWRHTEPEQPAADTSSAAAAAVGAWPVVAAAEAWPVAAAVVGAWPAAVAAAGALPAAVAAAAAEAEATAAQPVGTGGIGVAVHLHVVAALPGGGDAVVAAADANHQVVAAAGLCVVDCWPVAEAVAEAETVWMVAQSQEWELSGRC